jgi:signal transduction histidine kinase
VLALVFFGLQMAAVGFPLPLASRQKLSLYTAVIFSAALLFDPGIAMLVAGFGTLVAERLRRQPTEQLVFNALQTALQAGGAGLAVVIAYGDADVLALRTPSAFVAVFGAALAMYAVDVVTVSLIVAAQERLSMTAVVRSTLSASGLEDVAQFSLGLLAALIVDAYPWALPLVVLLAVFVYRASAQTVLAREHDLALRIASERTSQVRREFLLTASHELKTPITSIKAATQMLARRLAEPPERVDPQKVHNLIRIISSQVERLEALVRDLLDATRVEQGRLELRLETVDLVDVARQVLERFEDIAERRPQHTLVLDAPTVVLGRWDPIQLDHVLTNLISNALKYSPAGGEVRVELGEDDGNAILQVSDHGLGIAGKDQARLFEPFARGSNAGPGIAGTGLGLYITAAIVRRHGGDLRIDSVEGAGTTVEVRLPTAPTDGTQGRRLPNTASVAPAPQAQR